MSGVFSRRLERAGPARSASLAVGSPAPDADWPNAGASRLVDAGGLRWHVQILGDGPVMLALHGAGAATHSWRDLAPLLADRYTIVAPDLPGHGFSAAARDASLPAMARAVGALVEALGMRVEIALGHSAGAAVAARMSLDGLAAPRALVSLNGALLPLRGAPGRFFAPAARLAARSALLPRLAAGAAASPGAVERLIHGTGSRIDARGVRLYRRLASRPAHVAGMLAMMARWDLEALARDLPGLAPPVTLMAGNRDSAVPPGDALRAARLIPRSTVVHLPALGHLAHEEQPGAVARAIVDAVEPGC